jgi:hypothetical protein
VEIRVHEGGAEAPDRTGLREKHDGINGTDSDDHRSRERAWLYVGLDERNRELEIIAVEVEGEEDREAFLLLIHVMPTKLKNR